MTSNINISEFVSITLFRRRSFGVVTFSPMSAPTRRPTTTTNDRRRPITRRVGRFIITYSSADRPLSVIRTSPPDQFIFSYFPTRPQCSQYVSATPTSDFRFFLADVFAVQRHGKSNYFIVSHAYTNVMPNAHLSWAVVVATGEMTPGSMMKEKTVFETFSIGSRDTPRFLHNTSSDILRFVGDSRLGSPRVLPSSTSGVIALFWWVSRSHSIDYYDQFLTVGA